MEKKFSPHIHADVIKAWADGHKIEKVLISETSFCWMIDNNPKWDINSIYRIYDPLREVKEAFERGEVIELKRQSNSNWYEVYKGDDFGSDIIWLNRVSEIHPEYEWRVKPKEEFKVGDWIIVIIGNSQYTVGNVHRITDISKHNVIFVDGNAIGEYCIRKATKQEVKDYKDEVKREKLQALQEVNLRRIQRSGYNIVSCGNCGTVFTHSVLKEESVTCPGCLEDMDLSDCPDLW